MLVLARKLNQQIVIDGRIFVKILRIDKYEVKLGIQAPPEVSVHREEIYDIIQRNKAALNGGQTPPPGQQEPTPTGEISEKPRNPAPTA